MSYISGARLVPDSQVRIASTKMDGIEPKKDIHVVHWELKMGERADIKRFISISHYRGICHQDGLPLSGQ